MNDPNLGAHSICIVIPTFRRPDGLNKAIQSIFLQDIMNPAIRILVVDNNPNPVERIRIDQLSKRFEHQIEYVHEPRAGVSNARNAGLRIAKTSRYIAFLDDDMVASTQWLSSLLKVAEQFEAGIVFGPTFAVMPNEDAPETSYMKPFFESVIDQDEDGYTDITIGTGGTLLDLSRCELPDPPFDPDLNERGGEDDIFFHTPQTSRDPMRVVYKCRDL